MAAPGQTPIPHPAVPNALAQVVLEERRTWRLIQSAGNTSGSVDVNRKTLASTISVKQIFQVDGRLVAERTVIAQAIPPAGALWLGCGPRDRPPDAALGEVEVYMFRMWPDLVQHSFCEDGTVIGWNAQHWGVTSPKARRRDPNLLCGETNLRR